MVVQWGLKVVMAQHMRKRVRAKRTAAQRASSTHPVRGWLSLGQKSLRIRFMGSGFGTFQEMVMFAGDIRGRHKI